MEGDKNTGVKNTCRGWQGGRSSTGEGAGVSTYSGPRPLPGRFPAECNADSQQKSSTHPAAGCLLRLLGGHVLHTGLPEHGEPASTEFRMHSATQCLFIQPSANVYWGPTTCQARPYSFRPLVPIEPSREVHTSVAAAQWPMGGVGKPRAQLLSLGVGGVTGTTCMWRRKP